MIAIETAFDEGVVAVAKKLKEKGMNVEFIIEMTGLSEEKINSL